MNWLQEAPTEFQGDVAEHLDTLLLRSALYHVVRGCLRFKRPARNHGKRINRTCSDQYRSGRVNIRQSSEKILRADVGTNQRQDSIVLRLSSATDEKEVCVCVCVCVKNIRGSNKQQNFSLIAGKPSKSRPSKQSVVRQYIMNTGCCSKRIPGSAREHGRCRGLALCCTSAAPDLQSTS